MVRPPRPWLHLNFVLLACTFLAPAVLRAQSPPPAPVLLALSDDRPAPGDTIILTGTDLGSGSDTVVVHFDPSLTVPVPTPSSQQISLIVPQGAKTGNVSITVKHTMPDGTIVVQNSNQLPIMVIWKTFNANQFYAPYGTWWDVYNGLLHGEADDVYIFVDRYLHYYGSHYGSEELHRVSHDGTVTELMQNPWEPSDSPIVQRGRVAVNPVNKHVLAMLQQSCWGCQYQRRITDVTAGVDLWSCLNATCDTSKAWFPTNLTTDSQGNLIITGELDPSPPLGTAIPNPASLICIWRFSPTDPIVLDPNNANSLVPGGVSGTWGIAQGVGWYGWWDLCELAVGGDGTIYATEFGGWNAPFKMWRIPGKNGAPYDRWDLPPASGPYPGGGQWFLAADCRGEGYAINDQLLGWNATTAPLYRISDWTKIADIDISTGYFSGLNTDGYGNLYYLIDGGPTNSFIKRIMPQELPAKFYCPLSKPKASAMATSLDPCQKCWGAKKKVAVKVVFDPDKPDKDNNVLWLEDTNTTGTAAGILLFGQAPALTAYAVDKDDTTHANPSDIQATWEIVYEHVDGAGPKSLYPAQPEILFNNNPTLARQQVRLQTVHVGYFKIKVTPHGSEGCEPLTIDFTVTWPFGLGQDPTTKQPIHPEHDSQILDAANAFGLPPQYVKGHVKQEADVKNGEFNAASFRYEPRTVDWELLSTAKPSFWNSRMHDYRYYRMPPGTGSYLIDDDITPRDVYDQISGFNLALEPPAWPYSCRHWDLLDGAVLLWDIVEADDGWAWCSYPWRQYNNPNCAGPEIHIGPCNRYSWLCSRENNFMSYLRCTRQFYCGHWLQVSYECTGEQASLADWLLNGKGQTYVAQTPMASSYGLMQPLYTTAVGQMKWAEGYARGGERHPSYLFDVPTNLSVGVGYDVYLILFMGFDNEPSAAFTSIGDYVQALKDGFAFYRTGEFNKTGGDPAYADRIIRDAATFKPY